MNPVNQIAAVKLTRCAALAAAFQLAYRAVVRKAPPLPITVTINTIIATATCVDLVSTYIGTWSAGYPDLFTSIKSENWELALTFDDGPDPEATPQVLQILDNLDVKATFFLVGEQVEKSPDLAEEIERRGHAIALHGYKHVQLATERKGFCVDQIRASKRRLSSNALPYFRPPYGFKSRALQAACYDENVILTTWSINSKDYNDPAPDSVAKRVIKQLHPGAVILLHDWSKSSQLALPMIVRSAQTKGYSFVRLSVP